mgnify:CR=1 FL=1
MIANKICMRHAKLPSFLATTQFVVAVVTILVLVQIPGSTARADAEFSVARLQPFLQHSILFVGAIYSNLQALRYTSIETIITFRAACPLLVCVLEWCFLGRALPSSSSLVALLILAGSACGYVLSDDAFRMHGYGAYAWAIAYFCCIVRNPISIKHNALQCDALSHNLHSRPAPPRARGDARMCAVGSQSFESAYAKHIVGGVKFEGIWGPALHNNLAAIVPMVVLGLVTGEQHVLPRAEWDGVLISALATSCAVSVGISYAGWSCRKALSASCFAVLGTANKLLSARKSTHTALAHL